MSKASSRAILPLAAAVMAILPSALQAQEPLRGRDLAGLRVVEPNARDRDLRLTPVVRAVEKAADSVVSIYVNQAELAGRRRAQPEGQGSGVILDESGFVITNWHVVVPVLANEALQLQVKLRDGRTRPARVLSSSPEHDLALLQLRLEGTERVKPIEIGRSADLMIGEDLIAIGNPQGHANTVTKGVLSATGRSIHVRTPDRTVRQYKGLLQTDAAINQGNSGGALLDITGKLIGINNAMAMGAENIGFAIPVDTVREVFENQLLTGNSFAMSADTAWLGMEVEERNGAVVVQRVVAGGPAAAAGLVTGDMLVGAGGELVQNRLDYARRVLMAPVGQEFELRLLRGRREFDVQVRPLNRVTGTILVHTGMTVDEVDMNQDRALSEQVTRRFYEGATMWRLPLFAAVLRVRSVQSGSPAEELRLEPGDLLMASVLEDRRGRPRDYRIDSASDFAELLQKRQGRSLRLVILREDKDLVGTLDVRQVGPR